MYGQHSKFIQRFLGNDSLYDEIMKFVCEYLNNKNRLLNRGTCVCESVRIFSLLLDTISNVKYSHIEFYKIGII